MELNPNDFTPCEQDQALALYSSPGSLSGKLRAIWNLAEPLITQVEGRHAKALKKAWGSDASKALGSDASLWVKAGLAVKPARISSSRAGILEQSYFGALRTLVNIRNSCRGAFRISAEDPFPEGLFKSERLESRDFLDGVVPLFFKLQLHCNYLVRYANADKHVEADELTRAKKATRGGLAKGAKNYGEAILKADVITYLAQQQDDSFSSRDSLFKPPLGQLGKVLEEYQDGIGSPRVRDGNDINYGDDFTEDSLRRKINEWAKTDLEFKRILERVCSHKNQ